MAMNLALGLIDHEFDPYVYEPSVLMCKIHENHRTSQMTRSWRSMPFKSLYCIIEQPWEDSTHRWV